MTISDERFAAEDCVSGKGPNDFLVSIINKLPNYVGNQQAWNLFTPWERSDL